MAAPTTLRNEYNVKYELYFTDNYDRPLKLEILQKNYDGDIYNIIGTDNPIQIIYQGDDSMYAPLIGSRCKLNFYVTDSAQYDDFFKGDEREYKVKVLYYTSSGDLYEDIEMKPDFLETNFDAKLGDAVFWESYWEGFVVVDRWQEAVTSNPYPVSLEAVCGLGLLSGFDAPSAFKPSFTITSAEEDDTNHVKSLWYYLYEILKKTGHRFDIYVNNDTRKVGGNANDTIFHDITISDVAFMDSKLNFRTAKDVLSIILKTTNSRIFQSYGAWYIVNNSSVIDYRLDQATICPSGADIDVETDTDYNDDVDVGEDTDTEQNLAPNIAIVGATTKVAGSQWHFHVTNAGGEITSYSWTLDGSALSTSNRVSFPAESGHNGEAIAVTCTNANGSDSDSKTLTIGSGSGSGFGGNHIIQVYDDNLSKAECQPMKFRHPFSSSEVGQSITCDFLVYIRNTSPSEYKWNSTDLLQADLTTGQTVDSGAPSYLTSLTKTIVTSPDHAMKISATFTLQSGGSIDYLHLNGSPTQKQFTTTVNITNSSTRTTADKSSMTFTGVEGTQHRNKVTLTADSGYEFARTSDISGVIVGSYTPPNDILVDTSFFDQDLLLQNVSPDIVYNTYPVKVFCRIGASDQTVTLKIEGAPSDGSSPTATINPNGANTISAHGGVVKAKVTYTGKVVVELGTWTGHGSGWLRINTFQFISFQPYDDSDKVTLIGDSPSTLQFNYPPNDFGTRGVTISVKNSSGTVLDSLTLSQPKKSSGNYRGGDLVYFN